MTKPQANSKRPEKLSAIAEIDQFVKEADQFDDITMLGFEYLGIE